MEAKFTPTKGAQWKRIAPRAHLVLPAKLVVADTPRPGWTVTFDVDFDGEQVSPLGVHIESTGEAVSGTDLRAIAVGSLFEEALTAGLVDNLAVDEGWPIVPTDVEKRRLQDGPTPENLQYVAELYMLGRALRFGNSAEYVRSALGMPRPTLSRWLRKARDLELIHGDD